MVWKQLGQIIHGYQQFIVTLLFWTYLKCHCCHEPYYSVLPTATVSLCHLGIYYDLVG
jgi:hypothetical protein